MTIAAVDGTGAKQQDHLNPAQTAPSPNTPDDGAACWCGGKGWRDVTRDVYDGNRLRILHEVEYCSCPAGVAAKAADDAKKAENLRIRRQALFERAWFDDAGIPSRFLKMSLRTFPATDETRDIVERLTPKPLPGDGASEEEFRQFAEWRRDWERSLYLWGSCGSGKTGLAIAYARSWLRLQIATDEDEPGYGKPWVLFESTPDLFSKLRDTYRGRDASEYELIKRYSDVPLLILDDLGAEHATQSGWLEDRLFQLAGKRHAEERLTIFTSNLSMEQLAAKIGERVTWRILELCGQDRIIHIKGPNLRDVRAGREGINA
jgi:DNA replication protein DnaC